MSELELGKYEFFPYDDEQEKVLKEFEQSEMTGEEVNKRLEEILKEIRKRKRKAKK